MVQGGRAHPGAEEIVEDRTGGSRHVVPFMRPDVLHPRHEGAAERHDEYLEAPAHRQQRDASGARRPDQADLVVVASAVDKTILATLFQGRLWVDGIEHLGLDGVRIKTFEAFDPSGARVVRVDGLEIAFDGIANGRRLARGDTTIVIDSVYLREVDVPR